MQWYWDLVQYIRLIFHCKYITSYFDQCSHHGVPLKILNRHLAKNSAQTGARGRLELAVGCERLLRVEGLTVTLRWRTAIKALFLCFGFCYVRVGILCHEFIHHIPSFLLHWQSLSLVLCGTVKSFPVLEVYALIFLQLWRIYSWDNFLMCTISLLLLSACVFIKIFMQSIRIFCPIHTLLFCQVI